MEGMTTPSIAGVGGSGSVMRFRCRCCCECRSTTVTKAMVGDCILRVATVRSESAVTLIGWISSSGTRKWSSTKYVIAAFFCNSIKKMPNVDYFNIIYFISKCMAAIRR